MEGSVPPAASKQLLSGRLQGLKFMQRARKREEALQKQEEEEEEEEESLVAVVEKKKEDDSHWEAPAHEAAAAAAASRRRCVVILEGDPKPSATLGRMSFQNFNPAVEKIVEEVDMRRQKLRQGMSIANGEMSKEIGTKSQQQQESGAADANDEPLRKKLKTEKIVVVKTEAAAAAMVTSTTPSAKQSANVVADRHSQQPESKQGFQGRDQVRNPGRDWRQLRPPGREAL